jgi:hypothetical protein
MARHAAKQWSNAKPQVTGVLPANSKTRLDQVFSFFGKRPSVRPLRSYVFYI